MNFRKSLRFKILFAVVIVIIPLAGSLFYLNLYAMNVVRDQVSKNYSNLLSQYVRQTDNRLKETSTYLIQLGRDSDLSILNSFPYKSDEYVLTRQRIYNRLSIDLNYYNLVTGFFLYSRQGGEADDLIVTTQSEYLERYDMIREKLPMLMQTYSRFSDQWMTWPTGNGYVIGKLEPLSSQLYIGTWIDLESLAEPLYSWDVGEGGTAEIISDEGISVTKTAMFPEMLTQLGGQTTDGRPPYRTVDDRDSHSSYLLVDSHSEYAAIRYLLIVPEKKILQNLPFFQKALSWIPAGMVGILALYLIFLQRVFLKPMTQLMRGMRRIGQGRFDVRLNERTSSEFSFLNDSFNDMAEQIEHLKISVYEEKIRVQQAEFKHLQVQINPHFYMNCLNIIYNLAALKEYKTVQSMALHLSDYFRFIMLTHRTNVTVEAELKHIDNYLNIQKLRYPDQLASDIHVDAAYKDCRLPPLTVQPFVENAVLHGFKKAGCRFHVRIEVAADAHRPDEYFHIVISDNGIGFPPEMLEELQSETELQVSEGAHIGIWNVRRRLRLNYGEHATVSFENGEEGATVTIRLPVQYDVSGEEAANV